MKPWHTRLMTGFFPIRLARFMAVAMTGFDVFAPRTTSNSGMTLAGEKKWRPMT